MKVVALTVRQNLHNILPLGKYIMVYVTCYPAITVSHHIQHKALELHYVCTVMQHLKEKIRKDGSQRLSSCNSVNKTAFLVT